MDKLNKLLVIPYVSRPLLIEGLPFLHIKK